MDYYASGGMQRVSITEALETGMVGGVIGALVGAVAGKNKETAVKYAGWGAGLAVAGQILLFNMVRPSLQRGFAVVSGDGGPSSLSDSGSGSGSGWMPATGCPPGSYWSDFYGACVPNIPPPPPPQPFPATLADWEASRMGGG